MLMSNLSPSPPHIPADSRNSSILCNHYFPMFPPIIPHPGFLPPQRPLFRSVEPMWQQIQTGVLVPESMIPSYLEVFDPLDLGSREVRNRLQTKCRSLKCPWCRLPWCPDLCYCYKVYRNVIFLIGKLCSLGSSSPVSDISIESLSSIDNVQCNHSHQSLIKQLNHYHLSLI